ncbi:MAG: DUF983 domain-containing protein [Firmicutes bacterium]|nr:DUF983 domain-containing protein [Bacillota bacterium]
MAEFWQAVQAGLRLRCPACGKGSLYTQGRPNGSCPRCGWTFEKPGDGDWLVTWLVAYTVAALAMVLAMAVLYATTEVGLAAQVSICAAVGTVAVAALFRRCRGASAGILYYLRMHWKE